ncbi:MAG TPA: CSLREA domain-containing protein, partial [Blastocatellia bacterium]
MVVNTTADTVSADGFCSLREAIQATNTNSFVNECSPGAPGLDNIIFDLGAGTPAITLTAALPAVTEPINLNGNTGGSTRVELNGTGLNSVNLLEISAGNSTIAGLVISNFDGTGISLQTNGGNTVRNCYVGTNNNGTVGTSNGGVGLLIQTANNTVGGTTPGERNVLSGNQNGVVITGASATGNLVIGNYIGTNATGTAAVANGFNGVIINLAPNNTIGGATAGERNIISGNNGDGVAIIGAPATGNQVIGNYIGLNATGTAAVANGFHGVEIATFASGNTIGGTAAGQRNVISGNTLHGISIPSGQTGIQILGNYIGMNPAGTAAIPNQQDGINTDSPVTIGGTAPGAGNLISGNGMAGVRLLANAGNSTVQGNFIGTDATGALDQGNSESGISIFNSANNLIGGTTVAARNVISGNGDHGVEIDQASSTGNQIQGNFIGTNATGTAAIPNASNGVDIDAAPNNTVGGTAAGARNVISGNLQNGVRILGMTVLNAQVQGNFIGTDATGTAGLGNTINGVIIAQASGNTIGGTSAAARNIISANGFRGVGITGDSATFNLVQGNYIGTDVNGTADLGNAEDGVAVNGNAANNTIGGAVAGAGNLISGNDNAGIRFETNSSVTTVQGNFIGTTVTGVAALANGCQACSAGGIIIFESANNVIGGATAAARNVISGNVSDGIGIWEAVSTGNQIFGNYIGVGADGTTALGNIAGSFGGGVAIRNSASNNEIGGVLAGQGNLIANNSPYGVVIYSGSGNAIRGNSIFNNTGVGATVGLGIELDGNGVTANDAGDADTGANDLQNFPILTSAVVTGSTASIQGTLNSTASTMFRIEFFSNPSCDASGNGEGRVYLGFTDVTTDAGGNVGFSAEVPSSLMQGQSITATATSSAGNTSEFSPCACTFTLTPTAVGVAFTGGSATVGVTTSSGCSWTAVSNSPWITVTGGASGNGNGTVSYTVAANPGTTPRTGSLTIAGFAFYVTQAAPGLVLREDFGNGIPDDWTVTDGGTGALNWTVSNPCNANPGPPFVPPFAIVDLSCAANDVIPDETLETPPFDARQLEQVILQFDNWFKFTPGGLNVIGDVDISTNGGAVWVNVLRFQGATENPNTRTVNLTPFIPPNSADVRVRFHYYATGPRPARPSAPRGQELSWGIDRPTLLALTVAAIPNFSAGGDSQMVGVTAPAGYAWQVTEEPDVPWITIVDGGNRPGGTGTGTFSLVVSPYGGICPRTATVRVTIPGAGPEPLLTVSKTVTQIGSGLSVMPTDPALPSGFVGQPYSQTFSQTGSAGTITWSVSSGSLPAG